MSLPKERCLVCKGQAMWVTKLKHASQEDPRLRRTLCDPHAVQARTAKYNVQPLQKQREEEPCEV